ncbi:PIN domain-containing protein [Dipodascopsis uninucleata]
MLSNTQDNAHTRSNIDDTDDVELMDLDVEDATAVEIRNLVSTSRSELRDSLYVLQEDRKSQESSNSLNLDESIGKAPVLFVVDTNFLVSNLKILDEIGTKHALYGHVIILPETVIQELDGLKTIREPISPNVPSKYATDVGSLARRASNWIYRILAQSSSSLRGQKSNEILKKDQRGDDSILDCCRYFQEVLEKPTILLSNDRNLCIKALIYSIRTITYSPGITSEVILQKSIGAVPEIEMEDVEGHASRRRMLDDLMSIDDEHHQMLSSKLSGLMDSKYSMHNGPSKYHERFKFPDPKLMPDSPYKGLSHSSRYANHRGRSSSDRSKIVRANSFEQSNNSPESNLGALTEKNRRSAQSLPSDEQVSSRVSASLSLSRPRTLKLGGLSDSKYNPEKREL